MKPFEILLKNSMKFFCGDSFNFNPSVYKDRLEISSSKETNIYCFVDDSGVEIRNSSYTRKISGDSRLINPIEAIVYNFSMKFILIFFFLSSSDPT